MRGKLYWQANDETSFDFTAGYIDIDNGYDAFSNTTEHDLRPARQGRRSRSSAA
jgi:hypothetical protein